MSLEGKVAIVTGAARGIGAAIAGALASDGADCVLGDLRVEDLAETASAVEAAGRRSLAVSVDVSDPASAQAMVDKAVDTFGGVHILVNNAGITRDGLLVRMSDEAWAQVLAVNLTGTFNCIKAVSRPMMKARQGSIVNIASIIGQIGNAGQANYSASKAGVIALTKTAARELASRGIRVNAVAPGYIDTAMTQKLSDDVRGAMLARIPLGVLGKPRDVADVVRFLCGDQARYVTGQVIRVDGGMVM